VNCRKVNSLLSAYIDGELTGVEQLQVRRHLRDCACCHAEHESLLMTKRLLSGLRTKAPCRDLEPIILNRLDQANAPRSAWFNVSAWWALLPQGQRLRAAALVATGAIALMLLSIYTYAPRNTQEDPVASLPAPVNLTPPISARRTMPMQDFIHVHNTGEDSTPLSGGPTITPAGSYRFQYRSLDRETRP